MRKELLLPNKVPENLMEAGQMEQNIELLEYLYHLMYNEHHCLQFLNPVVNRLALF